MQKGRRKMRPISLLADCIFLPCRPRASRPLPSKKLTLLWLRSWRLSGQHDEAAAALAPDSEQQCAALFRAAHGAGCLLDAFDGLTIDLLDDIAFPQASCLSRAARFDTDHQNPLDLPRDGKLTPRLGIQIA
jgi:hypothetical protein